MDFKEIVNTRDRWVMVTHVNDVLRLRHYVVLKISRCKKISNRLYEVNGCYGETMYDMVSGDLIYKKIRFCEDFMLSSLNVGFGVGDIYDDHIGDILFNKMCNGYEMDN